LLLSSLVALNSPTHAAVRSFEELTDNPEWAEEIQRVYDNDIDRIDTTVGLFAERPPNGFGFSDTAFRIFVLMASRRLNSDRFLLLITRRKFTQRLVWNGLTITLKQACPY
jgi:hypothetical protein